jgi:hypothetical protein
VCGATRRGRVPFLMWSSSLCSNLTQRPGVRAMSMRGNGAMADELDLDGEGGAVRGTCEPVSFTLEYNGHDFGML